MKRFIIIFCTLCAVTSVFAQVKSNKYLIDSMVTRLTATEDEYERLDILVNLSDLASGRNDITYSKMLWDEAIGVSGRSSGQLKEHALTAAAAASIKLILYHLDNNTDSLEYHFDLARKNLRKNDAMRIPTYYGMIRDVRLIQGSDSLKIRETLDNLLKDVENRKMDNVYEELKRLYLIATSFLLLNEKGDSLYNAYMEQERAKYINQYYDLSISIPVEQDLLFSQQAFLIKTTLYKNYDPEYLEINRQALAKYEQFLTSPEIRKRPYYSQRARIRCLGALLLASDLVSIEESDEYFKQFNELLDKYPGQAPSPPAEYYRADILRMYYQGRKEYRKEVESIDTVLKYTKYSIGIPVLYKDKAKALAKLGEYREAYATMVKLNEVKDSISQAQESDKYYSLLDLFQVNETKLKYAESERKHQNVIITITISSLVLLILLLAYMVLLWRRTQESDAMKSAFINSMCHEIRTPLNVINGFTHIIAEEDVTQEEKQNFLYQINGNISLLANMTDDMINIAKISSSRTKLKTEDADICEIIENESAKVASKVQRKGMSIKFDNNSGESCVINTNTTYFRCIISNLIDNAVKFSDEGGILISYSRASNDSKIIVSVSDQGKGIPQDKHKWVFEKFTKLDDYSQGVGLGLYACKLMVSQLRGSIKIDKEYTQGTKVVVTLPLI